MADVVARVQQPPPGLNALSPGPPKCLGCGVTLHLTPDRYGSPAVDLMNLQAGTPLCQTCLVEKLREDATR